MSAIVEFYSSDPGDSVIEDATKIVFIETLKTVQKLARGTGTVLLVGSVVNDRGLSNVPTVLSGGVAELESVWGGFKDWLGDGLDAWGSAVGYNGNLFAMSRGLSAPKVVLVPVDCAIKDASDVIEAGVDLLIRFDRSAGTYGTYTMPAGTRIKASGGYTVATLEPVTWIDAAVTDQGVRCRQVSATTVSPVDISTITTFIDTPADATVGASTVAVTVPDAIDAAELLERYSNAFDHALDNIHGAEAELVACDRVEAGIGDLCASAVNSAVGNGYFQLAFVGTPLGTTAAVAQGTTGDGAGRSTLTKTEAVYCHPGLKRQFRPDSDNLVAPEYTSDFPSHIAAAFLAANSIVPENPAHPHQVLVDHGIVGVESLIGGQPNRKTHEQAFITQPIMSFGQGGQRASFHTFIMANGVAFATRRMSFYLWRNITAIAEPYHKRLASQANRDGLTGGTEGFLSREKAKGWIADYTTPTATWAAPQLTLEVAIEETGNADNLVIRATFGANVIADAAA